MSTKFNPSYNSNQTQKNDPEKKLKSKQNIYSVHDYMLKMITTYLFTIT